MNTVLFSAAAPALPGAWIPPALAEPDRSQGLLAKGTPRETSWNSTGSGAEGPVFQLTGEFGEGRVVGIGPHPKQSEGLRMIVPRMIEWCAKR